MAKNTSQGKARSAEVESFLEVLEHPAEGHLGGMQGRSQLAVVEVAALPLEGGPLEVQEPQQRLRLAGAERCVRPAELVQVHDRAR